MVNTKREMSKREKEGVIIYQHGRVGSYVNYRYGGEGRGEAWKDRRSSSLAVLYRGKAKERINKEINNEKKENRLNNKIKKRNNGAEEKKFRN